MPPEQWSPELQDVVLTMALQVLDAGDFATRWQVAKLLPILGSIAISPLIKILQDEDADLEERWFAGRLLGQFRSTDVISVLANVFQQTTNSDLASIVAQALVGQGTEAIAPLAALLNNESSCLMAVHALAQIPDAGVVAPMLSVVTHANPEVRAAAILALSNFRHECIGTALKSTAQDPVTLVRRAAAIGLGRWAKPAVEQDVLPVLATLLKDCQLSVCEQAAIALGRLRTAAAADLLASELHSPLTPLPLQKVLIRALAWMERPFALAHLQQALTHLPLEAQLETIQVLGRVSDDSLRSQAADILLAFEADDAVTSREREPTVLQALALAWKLLEDTRALAPLKQLQTHPHPQVAIHARSALAGLV